jgi:PilZ domain
MNYATRRNLRYHLRIPADLTAHITTANGRLIVTPIINISRAGMMISCRRTDLHNLIPKGVSPAPKQCVEISVDFSLPLQQQGLIALSLAMKLAHARRLSMDEFRVGLEFSQLGVPQKLVLEQYISENRARLESV